VDQVSRGDSVTLTEATQNFVLRLVWEADDGSTATIATVRGSGPTF
jgi:hypothetical protein